MATVGRFAPTPSGRMHLGNVFAALVAWALVKDAKKYFTPEAAGFGIAFLLCMAHCYNTAGVLRRPNASVYLSAILAAIYYLVRIRQYPDAERRL